MDFTAPTFAGAPAYTRGVFKNTAEGRQQAASSGSTSLADKDAIKVATGGASALFGDGSGGDKLKSVIEGGGMFPLNPIGGNGASMNPVANLGSVFNSKSSTGTKGANIATGGMYGVFKSLGGLFGKKKQTPWVAAA